MNNTENSTITVQELAAEKDSNKTLTIVDVREDYEWEAGHIEDATHIPLNQIPQRYLKLNADEPFYVICRAGGRSAQASAWLNSHGYNAIDVIGGMRAWADRGNPIVSDASKTPSVL